jgi:hypothetical protein
MCTGGRHDSRRYPAGSFIYKPANSGTESFPQVCPVLPGEFVQRATLNTIDALLQSGQIDNDNEQA